MQATICGRHLTRYCQTDPDMNQRIDRNNCQFDSPFCPSSMLLSYISIWGVSKQGSNDVAIKDVIGLVNQVSIRVIISVGHSFGYEQWRFCECVALFTYHLRRSWTFVKIKVCFDFFLFLIVIQARDRDSTSDITYSISGGNTQSLFNINSRTGECRGR